VYPFNTILQLVIVAFVIVPAKVLVSVRKTPFVLMLDNSVAAILIELAILLKLSRNRF
jgi:hypothetical protein